MKIKLLMITCVLGTSLFEESSWGVYDYKYDGFENWPWSSC